MENELSKEVLNAQYSHWEKTLANHPEMFGKEPSEPARKAAELFKREGKINLLELGGGQGRDTLFFARNGFRVTVLDYSEEGIKAITEKAYAAGLSQFITGAQHDVRTILPFADETFDACYSHMLFCMALTMVELEFLAGEVRRGRRRTLYIHGVCWFMARKNWAGIASMRVRVERRKPMRTRPGARGRGSSNRARARLWSLMTL